MVYDFENAAFNTPLGQTSKPFRTQFGYHVVKVLNKRPSKGKVQVAHIMIANTQNDSTLVPQNRIKEICENYSVDTIYHAAAYKHVPLVEHNQSQGVLNNIIGTLSLANAAIAAKVDTFVLISTDKAVNPINHMGRSKRVGEIIVCSMNKIIPKNISR